MQLSLRPCARAGAVGECDAHTWRRVWSRPRGNAPATPSCLWCEKLLQRLEPHACVSYVRTLACTTAHITESQSEISSRGARATPAPRTAAPGVGGGGRGGGVDAPKAYGLSLA